jgi:hypothetical protein
MISATAIFTRKYWIPSDLQSQAGESRMPEVERSDRRVVVRKSRLERHLLQINPESRRGANENLNFRNTSVDF